MKINPWLLEILFFSALEYQTSGDLVKESKSHGACAPVANILGKVKLIRYTAGVHMRLDLQQTPQQIY
jgi:hypothetical protein